MGAPLRRRDTGPALHERAAADLQYIRGTMERAAEFSAVPGRGGMAMGGVALLGAAAAQAVLRAGRGDGAWLVVWVATATVAAGIGAVALTRKAARLSAPLSRGAGRRFLFCLCPSLVAGALLTAALARAGAYDVLPGMWLLCYGAGVTAAGAFSPPVIPATGGAFVALGAAALVALPGVPAARLFGDVAMAAGFGGLHLVSGALVARRHGG